MKNSRIKIWSIVLLTVMTFGAAIEASSQTDARCYTPTQVRRSPTAAITWKVPVRCKNTVCRFRAQRPVTTRVKCIQKMDGVKIAIRSALMYRTTAYSGNVYDGQHLTINFRDIKSNQVIKTVSVENGDGIDWPRNTFADVDFKFPSFPSGVDPRRNRFAGSSITASVFRP